MFIPALKNAVADPAHRWPPSLVLRVWSAKCFSGEQCHKNTMLNSKYLNKSIPLLTGMIWNKQEIKMNDSNNFAIFQSN